jgi:glycine cleavage system H protein
VTIVKCKGYEVRSDLYYDHDRNLWVDTISPDIVRVGFDPLGVEVNGTLAQLIMSSNPRMVRRGEAVGTLEAEKFVGPLEAPLGGNVVAINELVVGDPKLIYVDCFDAWLFELTEVDEAEFAELVQPSDAVEDFERRVEAFKKAGVLSW